MIDYNTMLKNEIDGLFNSNITSKISQINKWYSIYEGDQKWITNDAALDYIPTKKITNLIKKLIDTRARFMFGKEPYFNIISTTADAKGSTTNQDQAQLKEDLLYKILDANKFHSKLLKARKDCSIGGKCAIKLFADKKEGLKIIFAPSQEFFCQTDLDDIDILEKVIFLYQLNDEVERINQRIKMQKWEMVSGKCILNETLYNGDGLALAKDYEDYNTGLDFIPVIIIQNGGLTGELEGKSDVEQLWDNQFCYNKMTSDDIDAIKFQMFGQDVVTDATEDSIKNIKIAPSALVDLQSEGESKQASMTRLESGFSYSDKFKDTVDRIKSDMYQTLDIPNVSMEQLQGVMTSGKSIKALYWSLISACEEDKTEWIPALNQMAEYIFNMIDVYNLYNSRMIAKYPTSLTIEHSYPIPEDEADSKRLDLEEVVAEVRSRKSYIKKWQEVNDIDEELAQIQLEKQMLSDSFGQAINTEINTEVKTNE